MNSTDSLVARHHFWIWHCEAVLYGPLKRILALLDLPAAAGGIDRDTPDEKHA